MTKPEPDTAELTALAFTLAYEQATLLIQSVCAAVPHEQTQQPGDWFDLTGFSDEGCVKYLEARELLARHPANPNWVTLFDESEAAR